MLFDVFLFRKEDKMRNAWHRFLKNRLFFTGGRSKKMTTHFAKIEWSKLSTKEKEVWLHDSPSQATELKTAVDQFLQE